MSQNDPSSAPAPAPSSSGEDQPSPLPRTFPPRIRTRSRLSSTASNPYQQQLYAKAAEDAEKNPNLRRISLLGSFLVALSAGSNYAFSSWAPQMQESAHLSSTSLNVVGLAGNAGVYLSGPFVGRWVDKSGPGRPLIFGAILVAAGYASLSATYTGAWSLDSTFALASFNLLTGLGNSAAFAAAMNAQAKSWDGTKRGTATAFVLSGFGLSAFFYSTLSHSLFPGNTGDYLLLLAFGSAFFYILGYFIIAVLPPPDSPILRRTRSSLQRTNTSESGLQRDSEDLEAPTALNRTFSQSSSSRFAGTRRRSSSDIGARVWLNSDEVSSGGETEDEDEADGRAQERQGLLRNGAPAPAPGEDVESRAGVGGPSSTSGTNGDRRLTSNKPASSSVTANTGTVDITGWKLVKNTDFILLFCIMAAISGSGLLLINNCGTITRTLYDYNKRRKGDGEADLLDFILGYGTEADASALLSSSAPALAAPTLTSGAGVSVAASAAQSDVGRSWPELLHASLALFGASHKVAYSQPSKMLPPLGSHLFPRDEAISSALGSNLSKAALDEHALVQQLQAHQVSAISLGNAAGRILIGLLSDVVVNYTSPPMRVWLLTVVCMLALTSQTLAAIPNVITTVHRLIFVTSLTGLMYGTLFGIAPSLAFEWFGVKHFSQNWGIVSLSPVVAGNVFNLLFGRIFDSHVPADSPSHQCPYGEECYRSVFIVTTACCVVATVLSGVLIARRAGLPGQARL
ncbi:hypothetical protein OC846_005422 [Tilletia horrida]|uniref:NFD4 C-terminal domain-containing protein n=1 Tax=Tilletia horrida TaxID=155126 RepID=A0AAN6JVZ9_9BASI|nr:hypothetical protein OC846_005422 [Tilletia horrida]KAK0567302.1 hypothetical protein OC861_002806 [Tilletia horrida]